MSTTMNRLDVASAITEQEVLAWWQDWYRFLSARLDLLELRVSEEDQGFDLDERDTNLRRRELDDVLRAMPEQRRTAFEAEAEHHRQAVHQRMAQERGRVAEGASRAAALDSREVERTALLELLDACKGDAAAQRMGTVPVNGRWWEVDPAALETVPDEDVYAIRQRGGRPPASRWVLLSALVATIWLAGGFLYFSSQGARPAPAAASETASLNGAPLSVWVPRAALLRDEGSEPKAVVLETLSADDWPQVVAPGGGWRAARAWPLELCLPRQLLTAELTSLTVQSEGDAPERVYQLSVSAPAGEAASLLVVACNGDGSVTHYGVLSATQPLPAAAAGAGYTLPDGQELVVAQVSVVGSGQETSVPPGKALVYVDVQAPHGVDWPALNPSLTLQDGSVVGQSGTATPQEGGVVRIAHLIDLPSAPLVAAWDLTDPASRSVRRWRLTLAPPPSRAEQLAAAVRVLGIDTTWLGDSRVELRLHLEGRGETPLTLTSDDIVLTQSDVRLLTPPVQTEALAEGKKATVHLELVVTPTRPLHVELGGSAYELTFPEGG